MWYGGTLTSAASSSSAPRNSTVREDVGGEVAVAEHGGLRLAGRAARVQQHGDVVRVDEAEVDRRLVLGRLGAARQVASDQMVRPSIPAMRAATSGPATTTPGTSRPQHPAELLVRQPVVDRGERHACLRRSEQRHRVGVGVEPDPREVLGAVRPSRVAAWSTCRSSSPAVIPSARSRRPVDRDRPRRPSRGASSGSSSCGPSPYVYW